MVCYYADLTSGDLIDVLTVMYNNESLSVTGDTTVNLALGETATLQASTSEITNAGAPEVVWKDENGNIQSISGTTTHLNFTSTQTGDYSFFVSSVCAADASSNKFTIVVEGKINNRLAVTFVLFFIREVCVYFQLKRKM